MKKTCGWGIVAAVLVAGGTYAESARTFALREDQRPAKGELELGVAGRFAELKPSRFVPQTDEYTAEVQARYGVTRDFSLNMAVPYVLRDTEVGNGENGVGDIRLGFELVTYRDIFDYPYIMPYAELRLPSGDEDKGLGAGDLAGDVGIALGSTMNRYWHFIADFRYLIQPNTDNGWAAGLGLVHELSKSFAVSIEGQLRDKSAGDRQRPKAVIGGMTYKPTKKWTISVFGGAETDSRVDTVAGLKVNYTFR